MQVSGWATPLAASVVAVSVLTAVGCSRAGESGQGFAVVARETAVSSHARVPTAGR